MAELTAGQARDRLKTSFKRLHAQLWEMDAILYTPIGRDLATDYFSKVHQTFIEVQSRLIEWIEARDREDETS